MKQFQCVATTYVFSINEFFTISLFLKQILNHFNCFSGMSIKINEQVSCSLSCTWMTIIDSQFYASDSLSWDVSLEYIASCVVVLPLLHIQCIYFHHGTKYYKPKSDCSHGSIFICAHIVCNIGYQSISADEQADDNFSDLWKKD